MILKENMFSANKPNIRVTISRDKAPQLPQLQIGPLIDWAGENIPDRWCWCLCREVVWMSMNDNNLDQIGMAPSQTGCAVNHLFTGG